MTQDEDESARDGGASDPLRDVSPPPLPGRAVIGPRLRQALAITLFAVTSLAGQSALLTWAASQPTPEFKEGPDTFEVFSGLFGFTQCAYVGPMILVALILDRPKLANLWLLCAAVVFLLNGFYCVAAGPW